MECMISKSAGSASELTIQKLQSLMSKQQISSFELVTRFIDRISSLDKTLNSLLELNPDALKIAQKLDQERTIGVSRGALHGIPVLLKDNINTAGMATTAGAHVFLNNKTGNAFIVDRLLEKGAIILGKANLSEWANYLCLECPNGYSADRKSVV